MNKKISEYVNIRNNFSFKLLIIGVCIWIFLIGALILRGSEQNQKRFGGELNSLKFSDGINILVDPEVGDININLGEIKRFSVAKVDNVHIYWYLDENLVASDVTFYDFTGVDNKSHKLKLELQTSNGESVSNQWNVIVADSSSKFSVQEIAYYSIIGITFLIIMLIIWLIVAENKKSNKFPQMGFGFSQRKPD